MDIVHPSVGPQVDASIPLGGLGFSCRVYQRGSK